MGGVSAQPADIETLVERMERDWAELSAASDGWELAAAHIRCAYGSGYVTGVQDRQGQSEGGSDE